MTLVEDKDRIVKAPSNLNRVKWEITKVYKKYLKIFQLDGTDAL